MNLQNGKRTITPVDWVALASLWDSANSFAAMKNVIMSNTWMGPIPNHWVVLGNGAGGGGGNGNDGSVIRITTPGTKILDSRGRPDMTTLKMETPFQHNIPRRVSCLPDSPACVANNDPRAARKALPGPKPLPGQRVPTGASRTGYIGCSM